MTQDTIGHNHYLWLYMGVVNIHDMKIVEFAAYFKMPVLLDCCKESFSKDFCEITMLILTTKIDNSQQLIGPNILHEQ